MSAPAKPSIGSVTTTLDCQFAMNSITMSRSEFFSSANFYDITSAIPEPISATGTATHKIKWIGPGLPPDKVYVKVTSYASCHDYGASLNPGLRLVLETGDQESGLIHVGMELRELTVNGGSATVTVSGSASGSIVHTPDPPFYRSGGTAAFSSTCAVLDKKLSLINSVEPTYYRGLTFDSQNLPQIEPVMHETTDFSNREMTHSLLAKALPADPNIGVPTTLYGYHEYGLAGVLAGYWSPVDDLNVSWDDPLETMGYLGTPVFEEGRQEVPFKAVWRVSAYELDPPRLAQAVHSTLVNFVRVEVTDPQFPGMRSAVSRQNLKFPATIELETVKAAENYVIVDQRPMIVVEPGATISRTFGEEISQTHTVGETFEISGGAEMDFYDLVAGTLQVVRGVNWSESLSHSIHESITYTTPPDVGTYYLCALHRRHYNVLTHGRYGANGFVKDFKSRYLIGLDISVVVVNEHRVGDVKSGW